MRSKFDYVWVGLVVGVLFPLLTCYIYYKFNFKTLSFAEFIKITIKVNKYTQLMSLSVAGNILAFFLFIWRNYLYSARGVLITTFLYTAVIVIMLVKSRL
ncbi:MAG: hypothetical protein NTW49_05545 [Bacteroidia bacterium]|nr:hypothetical protein [Bacteroidia bacterium]